MVKDRFDLTFVTYSELPELDPDDRLVVDALERRNLRVQAAVWDDPSVDWSTAGLCVLRSTWDYHLHRQEFLHWAARVSAMGQLVNDLSLIEWNSHKSYLKDLVKKAVPVVPTVWAKAGSHADLGAIMRDNAWAEVIIKPAVGLATFGVRRVPNTPGRMREGQAHLEVLLRTGDVMVQPYYPSVISYGERSLTFINGEFSHCVRKSAFQALLPAGKAGETPARVLPEELDIAYSVIKALPRPAVYARIDLVRNDVGCPRLLELELVEPSLFFTMHPPAAERFAAVLAVLCKERKAFALAQIAQAEAVFAEGAVNAV
jgi:hypothetical protein